MVVPVLGVADGGRHGVVPEEEQKSHFNKKYFVGNTVNLRKRHCNAWIILLYSTVYWSLKAAFFANRIFPAPVRYIFHISVHQSRGIFVFLLWGKSLHIKIFNGKKIAKLSNKTFISNLSHKKPSQILLNPMSQPSVYILCVHSRATTHVPRKEQACLPGEFLGSLAFPPLPSPPPPPPQFPPPFSVLGHDLRPTKGKR